MVEEAINEFSKIISKTKEEYHYYHFASKINNPSTSVKTYWPMLPLIPPLQIANTLVSDF